MNPRALPSGGHRSDVIRVSSGGEECVPSGFGTVLEYEHALQSSTTKSLNAMNGPHDDAIDRTLENQSSRLRYVMSLLKRRCDLLPCPGRFKVMAQFRPKLAAGAASTTACPDDLMDLVAQHHNVLDRIRWLARPHSTGDRGEALLAEVMRSHVHMIWWLTILLEEEVRRHEEDTSPVQVSPMADTTTEAGWENEGGAPRSTTALASSRHP